MTWVGKPLKNHHLLWPFFLVNICIGALCVIFLHALPSSSFALAFLTPSLYNSSLYSSQVTWPCFHCLCICFLLFGLTSRKLSVPATLSVDETSPTGCRESSGLLQVNYVVLHCWQQETQSQCPESWFHLHGATCRLLLSWLLIETLELSTCFLSFLLSSCLIWRHHTAYSECHFLFGPVTQFYTSTAHSTRPQAF